MGSCQRPDSIRSMAAIPDRLADASAEAGNRCATNGLLLVGAENWNARTGCGIVNRHRRTFSGWCLPYLFSLFGDKSAASFFSVLSVPRAVFSEQPLATLSYHRFHSAFASSHQSTALSDDVCGSRK